MYRSDYVINTNVNAMQINALLSACYFKYLLNDLIFFIFLLFKTKRLNRFNRDPIEPKGTKMNKENPSKSQVDPI